MKQSKLSDKPIRRGDVYCSSFCGGGCTLKSYQKAKKQAAALVKDLGKGWFPKVWENLGWHFAAISSCGRYYVFGSGNSWIAFIGDKDSCSGTWHATATTPKNAIKAVRKIAVKDVRHQADLLDYSIFSSDLERPEEFYNRAYNFSPKKSRGR